MAEWTNLFDLGECTVRVLGDGEECFSQVMAKGDSHSLTDLNSNPYMIAVSAAGVVSLSSSDDTGYNNQDFEVAVLPSYEHDFAARIREAVFNEETHEAGGAINSSYSNNDFIDYETLFPASPEPLDMSDLSGQRDYVGLFASPVLP